MPAPRDPAGSRRAAWHTIRAARRAWARVDEEMLGADGEELGLVGRRVGVHRQLAIPGVGLPLSGSTSGGMAASTASSAAMKRSRLSSSTRRQARGAMSGCAASEGMPSASPACRSSLCANSWITTLKPPSDSCASSQDRITGPPSQASPAASSMYSCTTPSASWRERGCGSRRVDDDLVPAFVERGRQVQDGQAGLRGDRQAHRVRDVQALRAVDRLAGQQPGRAREQLRAFLVVQRGQEGMGLQHLAPEFG